MADEMNADVSLGLGVLPRMESTAFWRAWTWSEDSESARGRNSDKSLMRLLSRSTWGDRAACLLGEVDDACALLILVLVG